MTDWVEVGLLLLLAPLQGSMLALLGEEPAPFSWRRGVGCFVGREPARRRSTVLASDDAWDDAWGGAWGGAWGDGQSNHGLGAAAEVRGAGSSEGGALRPAWWPAVWHCAAGLAS